MEETNIPDQLTYHAPSQETTKEPKDALFMAARIISAIFTPFMVPFVAFLLLFFFTYLRILPLQYKLTVLIMVYCFTILLPMLGIYLLQKINGWTLRELGKREKRFLPYLITIMSYTGCFLTMYRIHLPRYMSGIIIATLLCMVICTSINLKWKISTHMASCGMITFIQFHFPVQSYLVALRFYFTGRNVRFRTNHRPPTYFKRSWRRFFSRFVLRYHWNFVYLKHNYINL